MSMIERLLSVQTLAGPYLGDNRALTPANQIPAFQMAAPKPVALPPLQSVPQQLMININAQHFPQQMQPGAQQNAAMLVPPAPINTTTRLSQTTLSQIQQHAVECRWDLGIEELLILEALRPHLGSRRRPIEQVMPSPFAQLAWMPIEKPFLRLAATRRKLHVQGTAFMRFKFAWEEEEQQQRRRRQRQLAAARGEALESEADL